jgi:hypothetical protein
VGGAAGEWVARPLRIVTAIKLFLTRADDIIGIRTAKGGTT